MLNISSSQLSGRREVSSDELSESGGVVVTNGLRVTECFEYGVRLDDLLLQGSLKTEKTKSLT